MCKDEINSRVAQLRAWMERYNINAFIFPTTDPHFGEYTPEHWKSRQWISGFDGSAGTAVVTIDKAALWTDSRYFLHATEQLRDTPFSLMKERTPGTPSIGTWLLSNLKSGMTVGIDGWVNSIEQTEELGHLLHQHSISINSTLDPAASLWLNRPSVPLNKIEIQETEYAGTDTDTKRREIQQYLHSKNSEGIFLSSLDDIAWILNLRGSDVHCNPIFVSYLLITDNATILYINKVKLTPSIISYLESHHIAIKEYGDLAKELSCMNLKSLLLDRNLTSIAIKNLLPSSCQQVYENSPIPYMKAVKNKQEIKGFHSAMVKDGVAMVRFLIWLEQNIASKNVTEIDIDHKLFELRSQQALFRDISFDTIAAYKEHAAIVHYEATPQTNVALKPLGMLLLDSGAQYQDGTTDITRTIALGDLTEEEKKDYTLVLKGHINLSGAIFPQGTCGTQLDVLARSFMWKEGINYGHGTGHGVGSYLCVHEGPHQIRMNNMPALLQPGMTVTDEPGIYKEGRHGVRIENTLLIVRNKTTEFGDFYRFEPLTLCPIDKKPIVFEMLSTKEKEWLNDYHHKVFLTLSPLLNEEEKEWLTLATAPII